MRMTSTAYSSLKVYITAELYYFTAELYIQLQLSYIMAELYILLWLIIYSFMAELYIILQLSYILFDDLVNLHYVACRCVYESPHWKVHARSQPFLVQAHCLYSPLVLHCMGSRLQAVQDKTYSDEVQRHWL